MTHDQELQLLAPIISPLILGVGSTLTVIVSLGTARLRAWLDARSQADASRVVADASTRLQAAMGNSAGNIALAIQTGALDPTSLLSLRQAAMAEAVKIAAKMPGALAVLQPLEGSVVEGIMGKITAAAAGVSAPAAVKA